MVQRNKLAFAAGSAVGVSLMIGLTLSTVLFFRERAARERASEQAGIAQAVSDFLTDDLLRQAESRAQVAGPGLKQDPNLTVREALERAAVRIGDRFKDQPLQEAAVRKAIGYSLGGVGEFQRAIPHLERAIELFRARLGPDHLDTLQSMWRLAWTYLGTGKLDQALPMLEETLELMKARLGRDDPNTLGTMNILAGAYMNAGKHDQGLSLFEETLRLAKARLGPDRNSTHTIMLNLGTAYLEAGKLDQALPLFEEALKLRKAKLGPNHPETVRAAEAFDEAYRKAGKRDQLEAKYREQLAQQTGDVLVARIGLGRLLLEAAKTNSADSRRGQDLTREGEQLVREYLAGVRSRYTNDSLTLAEKLYDVADLRYRQGHYAEAEPLYRETIESRRGRMTADNQDVLQPKASLARLLTDWAWAERELKSEIRNQKPEITQRAREAERLLREGLAVRLRDSTNSWRIGELKSRLGSALVSVAVTDPALGAEGRQAKLIEAESLLLEGYERLQNASTDDKYKRDALERLVRLYDAWNKSDQRSEWQQKVALHDKAQKKSLASEK